MLEPPYWQYRFVRLRVPSGLWYTELDSLLRYVLSAYICMLSIYIQIPVHIFVQYNYTMTVCVTLYRRALPPIPSQGHAVRNTGISLVCPQYILVFVLSNSIAIFLPVFVVSKPVRTQYRIAIRCMSRLQKVQVIGRSEFTEPHTPTHTVPALAILL